VPPVLISEYGSSDPLELSNRQIAALQRLTQPTALSIAPDRSGSGRFVLTAGSFVGAVSVEGVELTIAPKIGIDRLMFVLSYAIDSGNWRETCRDLSAADSLVEAVAPAFARLVVNATRRGLLHGYRTVEERCQTVRGQIRFAEVVSQRCGRVPPIDVAYDDFTANIPENEVLMLALRRLRRLPIRSRAVRDDLARVSRVFGEMDVPRLDPSSLPEFRFTRLNQHYRPAIRLAELILKSASFELGLGSASATCFLIDMNQVFESFVHRALQEHLGLSNDEFPKNDNRLFLASGEKIRLKPDLSWWQRGGCGFVGDVKYKRIAAGVPNGDVYQMLSYIMATGLKHGWLFYPGDADETRGLDIPSAGRRIEVVTLDLSLQPEALLGSIGRLAERVRLGFGASARPAASPALPPMKRAWA